MDGKAGRLVAAELVGQREFLLTAKEYRFVEGLVMQGLRPVEAAKQAGFGKHGRDPDWRALLARPRVNEAIRTAQRALVQGELTNIALNTLRDVMADAEAPAPARVQAARTTLQVAGLLGQGARRDDASDGEEGAGSRTAADLEREHREILQRLGQLRSALFGEGSAEVSGVTGRAVALLPGKSKVPS